MHEQIEKALQTLQDHFGPSIFVNLQRFKAALADMPIETDAKKIRNLLNIAISDMKAYSRLESGLASNNTFIVDNLVVEMVQDYWPEESSANNPLLERAYIFLENSEWKKADEYCDRVLDAEPRNAMAYVGKICADLKVNHEADLSNHKHPLDDMPNYKMALKYADTNYRDQVAGYNKTINNRLEKERKEQHRREDKEREGRQRLAEIAKKEQQRLAEEKKSVLRKNLNGVQKRNK